MKDIELQVYCTVAGELVRLVEDQVPMCFVPYNQALELQEQIKELKRQLNADVDDLK